MKKKEKPTPLFKDCAKTWIEITIPATCKESTTDDYQAILDNHVLPFFEDLKINEITEGKIKELIFSFRNLETKIGCVTGNIPFLQTRFKPFAEFVGDLGL